MSHLRLEAKKYYMRDSGVEVVLLTGSFELA
jgi:hypothetical protein